MAAANRPVAPPGIGRLTLFGLLWLLLGADPFAAASTPTGQEPRRAPQSQRPSVSASDQVALDLRSLRASPPASESEVREAIARLGQAALGPMVEILTTARVPAVLPEQELQMLGEPQEELLLALLAEMPRARVLAEIERSRGRRADPIARRAQLLALGAVGGAEDVATGFEWARPRPGSELEVRIEAALVRSLGAMLRRDPRALPRLAALAPRLDPALIPVYLSALGEGGDERAFELLERALFEHREHEALVLSQIRRLPPPDRPGAGAGLARRVRDILRHAGIAAPELVQAAAMALGHMEDWEAAELLVPLAADPNAGIREAARWALTRLIGRAPERDPARLAAWFERQWDWFHRTWPEKLERLANGDPAQAAEVLREALAHPLFRHATAADLVELLGSARESLVPGLGAALVQLGSRRAVEPLLRQAERLSPEAAAARLVLAERLLGRELPAEPHVALELLFPARPWE